ncbi:LEA type 2 family protein [Pelobacter propionicus]|uniref:Water Stress and Hypersensitive response n=1 Tax=Pelobacter propionicus (strain DSM 2379 / NBRC 103807 / OttBd1) TaxID=338966 RepID=A1AN67_PELPD|nr:LEA type 2 family protein [Pelobacter propionicus]ABK98787.1 Water Stress and Hypersensitive response [Pelobacter propionicus DSM 2379]
MTARLLRFLLFPLLLLCGCSLLLKEPDVSLTRTSIIGMDTAGADIECALAISNPNSYDLTLQGYSYDLRVMSLPLAAGRLHQPLTLPAGAKTDMRLPIRVKYADLFEIIKRRPDLDRIPYRIQASLLVTTPLGKMDIPVDMSKTFSVPEKYRPNHYLNQLMGIVSLPR